MKKYGRWGFIYFTFCVVALIADRAMLVLYDMFVEGAITYLAVNFIGIVAGAIGVLAAFITTALTWRG